MKIPKIVKLPSGAYNCRVRVGGVEYSITHDDYNKVYAEAVAYKAGILKAKRQPERITVKQALERYIEDRCNTLSPSTLRGYGVILRNRFTAIMTRDISSLTLRDIQRAVNDDAKRHSPKSVRNGVGLLIPALRVYDLDIKWDALRLPAPRKSMPTVLDRDDLARLFVAVRGTDIELAVLCAAWLGMRRSEILALTPADFDKARKTVTISKALVEGEKNALYEKGTKTYASTRTLSCPDYILSLVPDEGTDRLLKQHPDYYRKHLQQMCRENDIPVCGMHALRHTNASVMLALNIADKYAMQRGGWSSNATMKNIYQHTLNSAATDANNAINSFFAPLTNGDYGDKFDDDFELCR